MSYRVKHREAVATVFDDNRGNFLEAIKLLAEYNPHRLEHLQVIFQDKQKDPSKIHLARRMIEKYIL